ncbi:Serine/Threonine kinase (macronuclear) [Tetrahymena thermophila SB210]|uniref:mitogen-activated protein kinase kinase n=1 Tax=Tetrahymena thermophila (strain SB210) TaxID=312017 RepID=I7MHL3_TETTS|nr:Serine/Threonine kinase [Tetrahymena thermophila SB210]EAR87667.1 Serine/Threonine kinase [Tetrahymena thermophila SB210]|eukprot:XP_001007912.1 Serine/Threonine kinase [Tetrahymena thermophila SB210]
MFVDQVENRESQNFKAPKIINSYSFNSFKKSGESQSPLDVSQGILNQNLLQQFNPNQIQQTVKINKRTNSNLGNSENNLNCINQDDPYSSSRRGPPKIHYHKLPSAFMNLQANPPKKLKPAVFSQMSLPKPQEEDISKKIDNMVDIQEYRQIQNLLSPLKIREGKVVHNKQKKLFSFHEQSNPNNDSKIGTTLSTPLQQGDALQNLIKGQQNGGLQYQMVSIPQMNNRKSLSKEKSNNNPLNPLREYIDTMQKFKDQFKEVPDLLMDKINQLILKNEKLGQIDNQYPPTLTPIPSSMNQQQNNQASGPLISSKFIQQNGLIPSNFSNPSSTTSNGQIYNQIHSEAHLRKGFSSKPNKEQNLHHTDSSNQNLNKSHSVSVGGQSYPVFKVRLEEMITLNLLKSNKNSGAIKKMLHAPTLSIFAVKEQPIATKDIRKILKDWLHFWPTVLNSNEQFIRVYGTCWNVPEGCVSIIMEHMNGNSLQDLLENIGNLNERAIQELTMQVISALYTLHNEHHICHGSISPSQILFNKQGFLKLSLGITNRTQNNQSVSSSIFNTVSYNKNEKKSFYDYQSMASIWQKSMLERNGDKSKQGDLLDRQDEIFKLGLLLLVSAIGNLDLLDDQLYLFFEQVQKQVELSSKNNDNKFCCLLHDEENIMQSIRKNGANCLSINILLKKYSSNFKDFLCKCLQYNYRSRLSIEELLKHPFVKSEQNQSLPSLRELISVSNKISSHSVLLPEKYQAASEKQLERVCEGIQMILPNCQIWFKVPQYMEFVQHLPLLDAQNPFILALANDLGIQPKKVHQKIQQTYEQIQVYNDFKHKFIFNPNNNN